MRQEDLLHFSQLRGKSCGLGTHAIRSSYFSQTQVARTMAVSCRNATGLLKIWLAELLSGTTTTWRLLPAITDRAVHR
eukprot:scaffold98468_cov15-Tisochrysis_lutea.AAC.1